MTTPLFDTHQHLLYTDRFPYSWTKELGPLENRAFTYEDYLAAAEGAGISGTLFMETTPDEPHWREGEPALIAELAARPGSLLRGMIANCRPEADDFEARVEEARGPLLRGFRRILHVEPDELSARPRFVESMRLLGRLGIPFDLCFLARQLPAALALTAACPGTQFILDHCGVPEIGKLDPWRGHIRELAARPNVACKISGVLAYCPAGEATLEKVRPYIEHCLESFGPQRVVWGSDWPVINLTSSLGEWVRVTREIMSGADAAATRALFQDNAARLYRPLS